MLSHVLPIIGVLCPPVRPGKNREGKNSQVLTFLFLSFVPCLSFKKDVCVCMCSCVHAYVCISVRIHVCI